MQDKALFIGLTTVDIQYFVSSFPSENVKVKAERPLIVAGGPAANAAVAYAYLGGNVDFLTCIGQNSFRELLLADLNRNNGLKLIDALEGEEYQPIIATVVTSDNSARNIFTHHPEYIENLSANIHLEEYSMVFTDGFYPELALPLCRKANELGIPVIFDGGSWKPHLNDLLPMVNVAICSEDFMPPGCHTKQDVFNVLSEFNIEYQAISCGENDIITPMGTISIHSVNAKDSLGAGDILHGAFCWFWLTQKHNFDDALELASQIASHSVKYRGTRLWMDHKIESLALKPIQ